MLELEATLKRDFVVSEEKLDLILAIGSFQRFKHRQELKFNPNRALKKAKDRHPTSELVGAYMDGEIGIDTTGVPKLTHWSLAELMLTNQLSEALPDQGIRPDNGLQGYRSGLGSAVPFWIQQGDDFARPG